MLAPDDAAIFGKAGTTGPAFEAALTGQTVVSAGSQGKYFWLEMSSPQGPHPVIHFGMTGWLHIKGLRTADANYYKGQKSADAELWPPRFCKFQLTASSSAAGPKSKSKAAKAKAADDGGDDEVQIAFTDSRRFSRVRLVACPGPAIRLHSPLVENGPDPVQDYPERFNYDYLASVMSRRHVPIKALLLDQSVLSGVGNWVGDEVLFQARIHPERYCDSLSEGGMRRVYDAVRDVCVTAVDVLGESDKFPKNWLFKHRWGKGGKETGTKGPNGERLAFITVGGRTSCYAPDLQKKGGDGEETPTKKETKMAAAAKAAQANREETETKAASKAKKTSSDVVEKTAVINPTSRKRKVKEELEAADEKEATPPPSPKKKRGRESGRSAAPADRPSANGTARTPKTNGTSQPASKSAGRPTLKSAASMPDLGRRSSRRLSAK